MRDTMTAAIAALMVLAAPAFAQEAAVAATSAAAEPEWRHGGALNGEPKYPADFAHFDYVDPDAPKGGTVRLSTSVGYDSFNLAINRGSVAPGVGLIYDTLMTSAFDEIPTSAEYGLVAEAMRYPDDYSWVEYRLNPEARWHDGEPITPDDVLWTLETLRAEHPFYAFYYGDVASGEAVDDRTVRFTFTGPGNRELPKILGQLPVLPKHWWTAAGPNGQPRDVTRTTLEPPLGSGAYKVGSFEPGRFVTFERVPEYWAADHPTQVGKNNFDTIRYEVFRDETVALEAFRAGRYDYRAENSARNWATAYDFDSVRRGDVVLETFPDEASGIMQAFVPNLRLERFQDERVRRALNLLFDFESLKDSIFYGQYERIASYFEGTELASRGLPEGRELEILEAVSDLVPPEVFTEAYTNPVGGNPQAVRENAREAVRLFAEAGYELRNQRLVNAATGEPFTIKFLLVQPSMERVVVPFQQSLRRIGIESSIRNVDPSQYQNRLRTRDFEMIVTSWGQSLSPGNEQRDFWGSAAADREESRNYTGIKDAGVDALIERVIFASDREDLVAATKALDRVLLHNDFVVPMFFTNVDRTARWNRFSHPDNIPPYTNGFPTIWWWDAEKADKVGSPS